MHLAVELTNQFPLFHTAESIFLQTTLKLEKTYYGILSTTAASKLKQAVCVLLLQHTVTV